MKALIKLIPPQTQKAPPHDLLLLLLSPPGGTNPSKATPGNIPPSKGIAPMPFTPFIPVGIGTGGGISRLPSLLLSLLRHRLLPSPTRRRLYIPP